MKVQIEVEFEVEDGQEKLSDYPNVSELLVKAVNDTLWGMHNHFSPGLRVTVKKPNLSQEKTDE